MNNKGFTVVELLVTISLTLVIVYGAIVVPTQMIQDYSEYDKLVQHTAYLNKIKEALYVDLEGNIVEEINQDTLQIGDSIYRFDKDGLYRENNGNNIRLNENKLYYNIENNIPNIYNDNINLNYSIGNFSFEFKNRGDENG